MGLLSRCRASAVTFPAVRLAWETQAALSLTCNSAVRRRLIGGRGSGSGVAASHWSSLRCISMLIISASFSRLCLVQIGCRGNRRLEWESLFFTSVSSGGSEDAPGKLVHPDGGRWPEHKPCFLFDSRRLSVVGKAPANLLSEETACACEGPSVVQVI